MGQFAIDLAKFAKLAGENAELVVKKVAIDLSTQVILRSPVGNPELWAANKYALSQRKNYNIAVESLNAQTRADPGNLDKKGKLRKGASRFLLKTASARALAKAFPLPSGKGYVGGRFRANWQMTIGSAAIGEIDMVDPSGKITIDRNLSTIAAFESGPDIWLVNNLPYAHRLEYDSWSKQAPNGMVRITVAEFQQKINKAVSELPK